MATQLVDFSDDEDVIEKPNTVLINSPDVKGVTVDTKYEPKTHILAHLEGSSWTVNYYSQILNTNNDIHGQQVNKSSIYQQYNCIEKFELKVTSSLTSSQDAVTKEFTTIGSANVYPRLIPNKGDMFIADIGDGREGLFKVTSSEKKSILKEAAHTIDYVLVGYATPEVRADLDYKSVNTYRFRNDFLMHGQNPIIIKSDEELIRRLEKEFIEIIKNYHKTFFSDEYQTLLIPGQSSTIYDHFLVKAMKSWFGNIDTPESIKVRLMGVDDDQNMKTPMLWDMLYNLDADLMNYVAPKYGLVNTGLFTKEPFLNGIKYTGISYVVYPDVSWKTVDYELVDRSKPMTGLTLKNVPPRTNLAAFTPNYFDPKDLDKLDLPLKEKYEESRDNPAEYSDYVGHYDKLDHGEHKWDFSDVIGNISFYDLPDIHPVTIDEYYVLSKAFYLQDIDKEDPKLSKLECVLRKMLMRKRLDNSLLHYFCKSYHSWGALERFYYLPLLLLAIRYSIRSY